MRNILVSGATFAIPDRIVAPALNTWSRLEPLPLSTDLQPALQASIADPLWLLCRQWQFLEFAGEDAGTPIEVRVEGESAPVSRYVPGALTSDAATRAHDYSADALPLEIVVEREPAREHHPRLAAEAGLHLQRMLGAAGLDSLRDAFIAAYPLALADRADAGADSAGAQWLELARGRALDGRKLVAAIVPLRDLAGKLTGLPAEPTIAAANQAKALDVLQRWLTWYEDSFVESSASDAWNPCRLEYAFAATAQTIGGGLTLAADEYADGTLDWYSVTAASASLGTPTTPQPAATLHLRPSLPSPIEYPGKPADRFWEFEDASIQFGAIQAGPTDLTRLLLVEFALIYGNDWFVVPVRLPVGSLFRVTSFAVRDTFGVVTPITRSRNTDGSAWSLFEIAGGTPSQGTERDYFFLPPTLAQTIEGEPVEQVALFRDEMANIAWGVERKVQGVSGDGYDRGSEASRRAAQQQIGGPPVDAQLIYRLATSVPEHWIPLVPVPAEGSNPGTNPVIQLQRRALLRTEADGQRRAIHPKGFLLRTNPRQPADAEAPLRIEEEEIPREGAIIERAFQFARWFDGRSLLWLGRRKYPGRGEGASGLRFDALSRK